MTIILRKDYPRVPPGGWRFEDPSGVTISGTSAEDLVDKITEFRFNNSLPRGNPRYELTLFCADRFPDFVEQVDSEPEIPFKTRSDYLTEWTNAIWKKPPNKLIPVKLAAKRIETCMKCPFRREWTPEAPYQDSEIVRKLIVLSQGYYRPDVGYCSLRKIHCGLACLIADMPGSFNQICWIGNESVKPGEE